MVYFRYWRGKKKGRYFGTLPSCVLAFLCYTISATQSYNSDVATKAVFLLR